MKENNDVLSGSEPKINAGPGEAKPKEAEAQPGNAAVQNIIPQIVNAVAEQQAEKPEFYQDPEGPDPADMDPENPLNWDLVTERPKRKRKSKAKKKASGAPRPEINLDQANADMQPAAGLNFNVQKLPARKKAGWFRRFLTATSYYAGRSLGKALNFIGNLFYIPLSGNLGKWWRSFAGNKDNAKVKQDKRDHETIPGWGGVKYEKGPGKNDDVIADFRRVPTVWSYLTAKKGEDDDGKPLPPTVGIYVNKPTEGADKDVNWTDFGHSGIGIEYSRYSRQTGRYERYDLRYGFYAAGGSVSTMILTNSSNVIVPGMLADEHANQYTVSRKFKATAKQVNDILNASETWADKGYNASTRNCTSFVKAMVRDVAHLPLGNQIFTEDHIRLSSLANMGYFASSASDTNAGIGMESLFEKLGKQKDLSYAGFGNMRYTKDEYRNYKDSLEGGLGRVTTADTPNSAAENMRRLEGKYAGEIGSYDFSGTIPKKEDGELDLNFRNIKKAVDEAGLELSATILAVTGKNKLQMLGMVDRFPDLVETYAKLDGKSMGLPLRYAMNYFDDPDKLRRARADLDENISDLNKLLSELKNDKRVHMPIVHLISLMNHSASMIDIYYNHAARGKQNDELQNIRGKMGNMEYRVTAGEAEAMMTPTHYESYLQIYKSPQEAVTKYARFKELQAADEDPARGLDAGDKKELEKLKRIDKLANQFDQSHRYMLEKGSYSQQDVDYAFDLSKKEKAGDANGKILSNSTSGIYQSLILEKIFGGMKQRYLTQVKPEDAKNVDMIREWLEEDLNNCVARKKDDFITVLRAILRTAEEKTPEYLNYEFGRVMSEHWFEKIFKPDEKVGALAGGPNFILEAFSGILNGEQASRFRNTLNGIFKIIQADDELAKPDSAQKAKVNA